MKPLGMTADFKVVRPSRAEDAIWDAVDVAKAEGRDLRWLISELKTAWVESAEEDLRHAKKEAREQ